MKLPRAILRTACTFIIGLGPAMSGEKLGGLPPQVNAVLHAERAGMREGATAGLSHSTSDTGIDLFQISSSDSPPEARQQCLWLVASRAGFPLPALLALRVALAIRHDSPGWHKKTKRYARKASSGTYTRQIVAAE